MDLEGEHNGEVFFDDSNGATTNLGLDFFSQSSSFATLASHSGVRGGFPHRGAGGVEGLDLNSQAGDNTDNMSYLDLLRSSSHFLAGEANGRGAGCGAARGAGRGDVRVYDCGRLSYVYVVRDRLGRHLVGLNVMKYST
jgi:hypothetical protein